MAESTYGTPSSSARNYYADLKGEGGSFTPTDDPNMHVAWRNNSRAYNMADYVATSHDAGYTDVLECRDGTNWYDILKYATSSEGTTEGTPRLNSRTTDLLVKTEAGWEHLTYYGCKTDRLEIRADQPGGIVEFDETVMAALAIVTTSQSRPSYDPPSAQIEALPAVQWVGGVTMGSSTIYPQNFRLSINNNLGRVRGWNATEGKAGTVGLTEGRLEMEFQMDVWMEDLAEIDATTRIEDGVDGAQTIHLTLGINNPVTVTIYGSLMFDGQHHSLVQDKQMETVRYRVESITFATPAATQA